jgi:5'-nucleotidase/UDP-sugar diphosphatase
VTLARKVPGINVIVGGHTQLPLFKADVQNGAAIVQAHEWGKYVGRVDLEVTGDKVRLVSYRLIPINHKGTSERINEDAGMLSVLRPFQERGQKNLQVKVGHTGEILKGDRDTVRSGETNLGNLITEAYRAKFNADLAVTNSGGIRDSIPAGDVTYEQVLTVLPFGNDVVTAKLTGRQLRSYLAELFSTANPGSGAFPQFAGIEAVYRRGAKRFDKLLVGGKKLDPRRTYVLALPSFIAGGGDRYPVLKNLVTYGYTDAAILREFFEKYSPLAAGHHGPFHRIKYLP